MQHLPPASPRLLGLVLLGTVAAAPLAADPAPVPAGYQLAWSSDFSDPKALAAFRFTDPAAWRISPGEGGDVAAAALELAAPSAYKPPFRSPLNIALLDGKAFTDVIIDAEVCSTVKPYAHQDMCFFYGMVSPTQFYYTHIAVKPDPHAHNCFIVDNAERKAVAKEVSAGVTWGVDQWHPIRIDRRGSDGTIAVYFDDLAQPIMRARDNTFPHGFIGFGSFDDKGKFRHVRVWAPKVEEKKAEFFRAPKH